MGCWQGGSIIQTWLPREICYRADLYTSAEVMYKDSPELYYDWNKPSLCYEYQFKTLCPFAFDSVVWYQGCSNAGNGTSGIDGKLLLELITRWRYDLRQNLHFTVVEIANCDFGADDWGIIQKAQTDAPNYIDGVTTVESKDISESYNETAYHVMRCFVVYYKINKFVFALNYGMFSVFHQMLNTNF